MRYAALPIATMASVLLASPAWPSDPERWEGWIVGEPCAHSLQIVDCPLRFIGKPVLLMENGSHVTFVHGGKSTLKDSDIDGAYGRKVLMQGELKSGVIVPARMDVLEVAGEKKFFKGCL